MVLSAKGGLAPQADAALDELCRTYWYPLYAYVRRRGNTRQDAEDLTQDFFARLLGKNYLASVDRGRGKFRAFLLATLKNFLANEWDRSRRQKRGGGAMILSLDWQDADSRYEVEPPDKLSPDKLFDRAWAVTLLERVVTRLRGEYAGDRKAAIFEQLHPFLMLGKNAIPYPDAARSLGLTEGAVRVAVHRLRRRYRELLRDEVGQTLADAASIDEEMNALLGAFAA